MAAFGAYPLSGSHTAQGGPGGRQCLALSPPHARSPLSRRSDPRLWRRADWQVGSSNEPTVAGMVAPTRNLAETPEVRFALTLGFNTFQVH